MEKFIIGVMIGGIAVWWLKSIEISQLERSNLAKHELNLHYRKMVDWLIQKCARGE